MSMHLKLPQGVKDFGPQQAEELRRVEEELLEEFSRWGYKRVVTPLFEYLDTITIGLGEELKSKVMKFVDPSTGDIVALRPDITPQIGRIVATRLKGKKHPLRLCYSGRIVRFEEKGSGKEREIFQAGCELIGAKSPECDAEIISLAIKSLQKLGLKNLVLDIGHSGILRSIFSRLGDLESEFREALKAKQFEIISSILKKSTFDKETTKLIIDFCNLENDPKLLKKVKAKSIFKKEITELEKVLAIVDEYKLNCDLTIDIGDIRGFNYYTGITFEIISPDAASPLLIGGRYDSLVKKYGYDAPATGFAIDMEELLSVTKQHLEDNQVHFIVTPKSIRLRKQAIQLTQWLRSSGFKVILDVNGSKEVTKLNSVSSLTSYGKIIIESQKKLKLIESRSGVKREFSNLEELLKGGF